MGTALQLLYLTKIFKMAAELCKGVLRPISGNMDVNTLASKRSGLIGNPKILRMRRVIHNNSSCVCLRLPFAAITQKRKNARVDLWPALGTNVKISTHQSRVAFLVHNHTTVIGFLVGL